MEENKRPLTIGQVVEEMKKGNPEFSELARDIKTASESFCSDDRSFDCRRCGTPFIPQEGQWIFYNLCDECFLKFNTQKMCGRFRGFNFNVSPDSDPEARRHIESLAEEFGGGNPCEPYYEPYYESCDEWIEATKAR